MSYRRRKKKSTPPPIQLPPKSLSRDERVASLREQLRLVFRERRAAGVTRARRQTLADRWSDTIQILTSAIRQLRAA